MTQVYPLPMPPTNKITDGTPMTNPTPTDATLATNPGNVYHPNIWSEKVKNHPGSSTYGTAGWENIPEKTPPDPDFVNIVLVSKSCNMPY